MTNANLDLNKMGLTPLSDFEMQEIDGGGLLRWIGAAVGAVVGFVVAGVEGAVYGAVAGYLLGSLLEKDPGTGWVFQVNQS